MRIGIIGSFGCGKTTVLANAQSLRCFQDYHTDIATERRVAQTCKRLGINSKLTYQQLLLNHEVSQLHTHENYLTDNPLPLITVYVNLIETKTYGEEGLKTWLFEGVKRFQGMYDKLFFVSPDFPLFEGRTEEETEERRQRIHRDLLSICSKLTYVYYLPKNQEERVDIIRGVMGS